MKRTTQTSSRSETIELACKLGILVTEPITILLRGDLAAGKTTFVQGLAKGLGITSKVSSPTFTIMKVHKGRLPLYHIDAYRLEDIDQDLGFEEYVLSDDGVCVVEWPDYVSNLLPIERLELMISVVDEDARIIEVSAVGDKYIALLEKWL